MNRRFFAVGMLALALMAPLGVGTRRSGGPRQGQDD
jgi:hypothetical protein